MTCVASGTRGICRTCGARAPRALTRDFLDTQARGRLSRVNLARGRRGIEDSRDRGLEDSRVEGSRDRWMEGSGAGEFEGSRAEGRPFLKKNTSGRLLKPPGGRGGGRGRGRGRGGTRGRRRKVATAARSVLAHPSTWRTWRTRSLRPSKQRAIG